MNFPEGTTEHPINKSGKKKILVSVWDFGAVHPQSERSYYLCNDHPAKMRPALARAILQLYGESPVLDPMAGIGTTLVEAVLLGMDAIGVEFEKKFVNQANKNTSNIRKLFPHKDLGRALCMKGDARDLSCLSNRGIRSIVFSPPYFNTIESVSTGHQGPEGGHLGRQHRFAKEGKSGYGHEDNLGHVERYGSVIFSPPYFDALSMTKGGGSKKSVLYEEATRELQMKRSGPFAVRKNLPTPYSSRDANIGNISQFGSIMFSPPFGEANRGSGIAEKGYEGKHGKDKGLKDRCDRPLSEDRGNISNVQYGKTYLGEMFKVYGECFRVLKPGKFMVVVVKDIRRKGLTIPLGSDTLQLCQMVGFELFDIVVNKMYFPSFWQLTHAQKTQAKGIPMTLRTHEYVLVFRKQF